jgi:microtubule-associated protein-like 6
VSATHVLQLEDEMRCALRRERSVYEGEKAILTRRLREFDDGDSTIVVEDFVKLWGKLQVNITLDEAAALFLHLGSANGRLANEKLIAAMLAPRSRPAASESVRKSPFPFGQATAWAGKILYRQCRSGVYAPSDWDPNLALRSSQARCCRWAALRLGAF